MSITEMVLNGWAPLMIWKMLLKMNLLCYQFPQRCPIKTSAGSPVHFCLIELFTSEFVARIIFGKPSTLLVLEEEYNSLLTLAEEAHNLRPR